MNEIKWNALASSVPFCMRKKKGQIQYGFMGLLGFGPFHSWTYNFESSKVSKIPKQLVLAHGIIISEGKRYTEGPSTCHRVTKSSSNRETRYNTSPNLQNQCKLDPNLQNQCKLDPSTVLTPVLSDVAANSAWVPRVRLFFTPLHLSSSLLFFSLTGSIASGWGGPWGGRWGRRESGGGSGPARMDLGGCIGFAGAAFIALLAWAGRGGGEPPSSPPWPTTLASWQRQRVAGSSPASPTGLLPTHRLSYSERKEERGREVEGGRRGWHMELAWDPRWVSCHVG